MKKISTFVGSALAAVSAAVLFSCQPATQWSGATDTVKELDAPDVTATAYPGVNYVTWTPVPSANKYIIYRAADGQGMKCVGTVTATTYSKFAIDDVAGGGSDSILDGVKYTYYVEATNNGTITTGGTSDPIARQVYLGNSMGEDSVTATVPPAGTPVYKLIDEDYEDEAAFLAEFKEEVKKGDFTNGAISLSFPAMGGLVYSLYVADAIGSVQDGGNAYTDIGKLSNTKASVYQAEYLESYTAITKIPVLSSGEKEIIINIASASPLYNSVYYKTGEKLKVNALKEAAPTVMIEGKYTSADTVRVSWAPAKLLGGKEATKENYKVYRVEKDGNGGLTEVAGVKDGGYVVVDTTAPDTPKQYRTTYCVEDKVPSNKVSYKYYVVLTDGTNFGTTQSMEVSKYSIPLKDTAKTDTEIISVHYLSNTTARIAWKAAVLKDGTVVDAKNYTVYRRPSDEKNAAFVKVDGTIKDGEFVKTGDVNKTSDTSTVETIFYKGYYIDDAKISDNTVSYTYRVEFTDGAGNEGVSKPMDLAKYAETSTIRYIGAPSAIINGATDNKRNDIELFFNTDKDAKPYLEIYYATLTKKDFGDKEYKASAWTQVPASAITWTTTLSNNKILIENLDDGTYKFKFVCKEPGKLVNTQYSTSVEIETN